MPQLPPLDETLATRRVLTRAIWAVILFVLARMAVATAAPQLALEEIHRDDWVIHDWMMVMPNLALAGYLYHLGRQRWSHAELANLPGRGLMAVLLGLGVMGSCAYSWGGQMMAPMDKTHDNIRVAGLFLGLALAVAEETALRGVIFKAVQDLYSTTSAIIFSAGLFALLHAGERICPATPRVIMGGLCLSIARARGLSLPQLIGVHFVVEAAWAAFLPMPGPMDMGRELIAAAAIGVACVILWKIKPVQAI